VNTGQERLETAQLLPVLEGMVAWVSGQHRQAAGGLRQILIFNPEAGRSGPDGEWAFPLQPA
jgi:hypothetical protein